MRYQCGYKYQLASIVVRPLPWYDGPDVESDFCRIAGGVLCIFAGYAWDGPSGPTIDTLNSMRASLVHDAGYQLEREHGMGYRDFWDLEFYQILKEAGMWGPRAWLWYHTVRPFAGYASRPFGPACRPLIEAP